MGSPYTTECLLGWATKRELCDPGGESLDEYNRCEKHRWYTVTKDFKLARKPRKTRRADCSRWGQPVENGRIIESALFKWRQSPANNTVILTIAAAAAQISRPLRGPALLRPTFFDFLLLCSTFFLYLITDTWKESAPKIGKREISIILEA